MPTYAELILPKTDKNKMHSWKNWQSNWIEWINEWLRWHRVGAGGGGGGRREGGTNAHQYVRVCTCGEHLCDYHCSREARPQCHFRIVSHPSLPDPNPDRSFVFWPFSAPPSATWQRTPPSFGFSPLSTVASPVIRVNEAWTHKRLKFLFKYRLPQGACGILVWM